jgi:hypothetical protein
MSKTPFSIPSTEHRSVLVKSLFRFLSPGSILLSSLRFPGSGLLASFPDLLLTSFPGSYVSATNLCFLSAHLLLNCMEAPFPPKEDSLLFWSPLLSIRKILFLGDRTNCVQTSVSSQHRQGLLSKEMIVNEQFQVHNLCGK